ncbi:hypothetical protein [Bartonella grahamii]|uniref:hypothetical protein n=1 Tax=Bartonella grahamii TaxID=33045 RepID=UPI001ABA2E63|nr:hypothetical protein [Bartonella grahamii]
MSKRFILLVIAISTLLFANHANGEKQVECANGEIPVYQNSSFIKCVSKQDAQKDTPDWLRRYKLLSIHEQNNRQDSQQVLLDNQPEKKRFGKDKIIEWFIIGFIIITIMSLPINILWRFRLKIPAFLFAIMTTLAVIAIPFVFY